jgi:hypothetical protein
MSGNSEEGYMRAAIITGDGGEGGAPIEFAEGEMVAGLRTAQGRRQEEGEARGCIGVRRGG